MSNNKLGNYITKIIVKSLFGTYDYEINNEDNKKLLILYGDNGCGKTTILELLYYILSTDMHRGHKTFIGNKKFAKFEIDFFSGHKLIAYRDEDELIGSYTITIESPNEETSHHRFNAKKKIYETNFGFELNFKDEGYTYSTEDDNEYKLYQDLVDKVKKIGVNANFLSEQRRFFSLIEQDDKRIKKTISPILTYEDVDKNQSRDKVLLESIQKATKWFKNQSIKASDEGSLSVNKLYLNLLNQLGKSDVNKHSDYSVIAELKKALSDIQTRSKKYSRFGLAPEMEVKNLLSALDSVMESNYTILKQILEPYIKSCKARYKALDEIENIIDKFITNLNEIFLKDKIAEFDIISGLHIFNQNKEEISLLKLSSGEKQLLLLLCNALASRDEANLFIIDEPELSLNVKWKRGLLKALLDCVEGSDSRFLIATHSFELITPYKDNIVRL